MTSLIENDNICHEVHQYYHKDILTEEYSHDLLVQRFNGTLLTWKNTSERVFYTKIEVRSVVTYYYHKNFIESVDH